MVPGAAKHKLESTKKIAVGAEKNLRPSCVDVDRIRKSESLKKNDEMENRAHSELATNVKEHGLDGLPLALAQAGSSYTRCELRLHGISNCTIRNQRRQTYRKCSFL